MARKKSKKGRRVVEDLTRLTVSAAQFVVADAVPRAVVLDVETPRGITDEIVGEGNRVADMGPPNARAVRVNQSGGTLSSFLWTVTRHPAYIPRRSPAEDIQS